MSSPKPLRKLSAAPSDFAKLWFGQAVSRIGSYVTLIGLPLTAAVYLHASPWQMGLLASASAAPVLVFSLVAGVWVDRLRRRPIMIAADLGRALILSSIPLAAWVGRLTIVHLYLAAMLCALLTVFFDIAYPAWVPSLVLPERLVEANSRLALTESIAEIVGPSLTGALVQILTAPIAILCDALSFVISALGLGLIGAPEPPPASASEPHIGREIADGLRTLWRNPVLRALGARSASASFFLGFGSALYILFVTRELGLGAALLGIVITVGGAANLVGAILANRLSARWGQGPTLIAATLAIGTSSLMVPLTRGSVAVCAAVLIVSQLCDVAWPVYTILETSLRQSIVPSHLLGRVQAARHLLSQGLLPLGALTSGAIATRAGIRGTLLLGAAGMLLSTLWLTASPVRRLSAASFTCPPSRS